MSKHASHSTHGKSRFDEDELVRGGRDRMLGNKPRVNYGGSRSRLPLSVAQELLRDESQLEHDAEEFEESLFNKTEEIA